MSKRKRRVRQAWKKARAAGWRRSMKAWARVTWPKDADVNAWLCGKINGVPF